MWCHWYRRTFYDILKLEFLCNRSGSVIFWQGNFVDTNWMWRFITFCNDAITDQRGNCSEKEKSSLIPLSIILFYFEVTLFLCNIPRRDQQAFPPKKKCCACCLMIRPRRYGRKIPWCWWHEHSNISLFQRQLTESRMKFNAKMFQLKINLFGTGFNLFFGNPHSGDGQSGERLSFFRKCVSHWKVIIQRPAPNAQFHFHLWMSDKEGTKFFLVPHSPSASEMRNGNSNSWLVHWQPWINPWHLSIDRH